MSRRLSVLCLLATAALPTAAYAQSADGSSEDVIVTGTSASATKTDTAVIDVPQSLSIIDERRLEDRAPRTINEALAYTPGVNVGSYGFDTRYDAFFLRGFNATYTGVFRDGLRQLNSPSGIFRNEPYGLESLTVVRGPASVLYGASGAGGLIDLTSKRPTDTRFAEVEGLIGSYDRYQVNADLGGPIGDNVAYRLTGVFRDSGTQLDGFPDDRLFIAPAVSVQVDDRTKITLLGEYMKSKTGGSAAFYNDANGITDIFSSDPRYNEFEHEQWRAGYELEHQLTDTVSLHQNLRFQGIWLDLGYSYFSDPTPPIARFTGRVSELSKSFSVDNQLRANLTTGALTHRILVGVDYNGVRYRSAQGFGTEPIPATGAVEAPPLGDPTRQRFQQTGVYAQDQIEVGRLGITAGIRHDWLDARTQSPGVPSLEQNNTALTGRVGVTYKLDGGFAPYANWSTSFEPNIGLLVDGTPARPTKARQFEGGIKWQPRAGILLTAAAFDIRQRDGIVFDASSGVNEQVQLDLRSRGLEFEASVRVLKGLDLTAAYALTDVEIERGAQGTTGNTLNATPRHTASAWADYADAASGFGIGGGVRYFGNSFGNDQNTIRNGDRGFVDAVAHYDVRDVPGLRLQLNAYNLFDSEPTMCAAGYCYRDQGRTVLGSARFRF